MAIIFKNSSTLITWANLVAKAKGAKIINNQEVGTKIKNELMESHEKCIER